jgi:2-(1,2-epoxy-1,2-dihydrophenyl)acetyl-CoA isomerase
MDDDTLLQALNADGVLTVTLNRPAAKNAFTTVMQRRMIQTFYDASRDPGVRVLVVRGAGDAFCTGGDIRTLGAPDPDDPIAQRWASEAVWGAHEARVDRLRKNIEASLLLYQMGKPTIAMVRGPAAGAGMSLALACDFRIVSEKAYFVTSFAKVGMSGDFGGTYFLTKLVGPSRAKELYMLSERVTAAEALELGIVNRVVSDAELESETGSFAARLSRGAPLALRYIKENVHAAVDGPLERALDEETHNMIRTRLTEDAKEAMQAFTEKRDATFRGV